MWHGVTPSTPEWLIDRKLPVNSQCTRSCGRDVPNRKVMNTSWIFPKKVTAVFPPVWSQCSQSVKFKMSQNGEPKMVRCGTFGMSPSFRPQWSTSGIFWGYFGNTANTFKMYPVFQFPWNVFAVFPKYPQNIPDVDHCGWNDGEIPNVPCPTISSSPFWLILNFTDWEHCDHTGGNITKEIANEPLGNITSTFFGKIQGEPTNYLIRTLWSHDLEHCKCTEHFPSMRHSDISWVLSLGKILVYPWIT